MAQQARAPGAAGAQATGVKPLIFISHINEERGIAIALKDLIEDAFPDTLEVFVASDWRSIPAGKRWLDHIIDALKNCVVEIILSSPKLLFGRGYCLKREQHTCEASP